MNTDYRKATARRWFTDIITDGRMNVADEIFAAGHQIHDPHAPPAGWPAGPEGLKQVAAPMRTAFPDLKVSVEDQIAEGDKVVTRWSAVGTHNGPLKGMPPSGRRVRVTGANIVRFEDSQIVESWFNFDMLGLLRQVGAIPMPPQPA